MIKVDVTHESEHKIIYFTPPKSDRLFPYAIVVAGSSTFLQTHPIISKHYRQHTFIYTTAGVGHISLEHQKFDATLGTVTWLDTSLSYTHRCHPKAECWSYIWFGATGFGLDELLAEQRATKSPICSVRPSLEETFKRTLAHLESPALHKGGKSNAYLASIIASLTIETGQMENQKKDSRLAISLDFIRGSLAEKWTIERMADCTFMSTSHFHRRFKQEVGLSPMEWLRIERINAAKYKLVQTGNTVAAIGAECGFPDPYHFSREFKRVSGETPSAFRKSMNGGILPSGSVILI